MDCNLSWSFHINYISTKVSKSAGLTAKLGNFVPQRSFNHVILGTHPPLPKLWNSNLGSKLKSTFQQTFTLTKTSIEIYRKSNHQIAIPLFVKTKIPPLNIMHAQSLSSLMHDVINKSKGSMSYVIRFHLCRSPVCLSDIFACL